MTNSDWITLGAAILTGGGTLFLGIMAWRAIRQTRRIHKREQEQRLLNKIVEWATQILIIGRDIGRGDTDDLGKFGFSMEYRARWNVLTWRQVHIRNIATYITSGLEDIVFYTNRLINQHIRILDLEYSGKIKKGAAVGRHRKRLDDMARLLIERCVELLNNNSESSS